MFRPQIQKTRVLAMLALLNLVMVYWALNSYERQRTFGFEVKSQAVQIMESTINSLRESFIQKAINTGTDSDSFGDFLIGPQNSIIQTTKGSQTSKQSVLNPDFAAMVTEMLIELEIDSSDRVAVSYTGSYPGANIAVLSALEAIHAEAVIISSCGASEFGATNPEITWIDMENYLFEKKVISNRSYYASIGGGYDLGSQLGIEGRKICEKSIYSNGLELLNIGDLKKNIESRIKYYNQDSQGNDIVLFINVGGGIYSIGDSLKRQATPPGIIYPGDINSAKNQTVIERFLNDNIPIVNINQIHVLTEWYELPYPPDTKYQFTTGSLFYSKKQYNPKVILLAFIISAGAVLATGLISHREIKERMHSSEPESII